MSAETRRCPRRETMLQRLLAEDTPGNPTADELAHARNCEDCARTLQSLHRMEDILSRESVPVDKPGPSIPPSAEPGLEPELEPAPEPEWNPVSRVPVLSLAMLIVFLALAGLLMPRSPSVGVNSGPAAPPSGPTSTPSVLPPPVLPALSPVQPPPQLMLVSGKLFLPDGSEIMPGKPFPAFEAFCRAPEEVDLTIDKDIRLHLEHAEALLDPQMVNLLQGVIEVSIDRQGRAFRVKTPAVTVSASGTRFRVQVTPEHQSLVSVSEGIIRVETAKGLTRILKAGDKGTVVSTGDWEP